MVLKDLSGLCFGRLTVIRRAKNIGMATGWRCRCTCGRFINVRYRSLSNGDTKSCGCLRVDVMTEKQLKHGHYNTSTYHSYRSMLGRCLDPTCKSYYNYGGRGITICDRWLQGFQNFLDDMGIRPPDRTLDRINVNGNYEPQNCRWADKYEQARNKRQRTISA